MIKWKEMTMFPVMIKVMNGLMNFLQIISERFNRSKFILSFDSRFFNDTHSENWVLPNPVQEFIEIESWLLLTFLLYLHNQLTF